MNRIDRVTAILIQLQSRKVVKAQDIADRFGISLRTVYRDINTLCEAGVPIIGEAGVGYSIMEGYRLPPVMFTREEATAFLTAEKLIEKLTDNSIRESYQSAMYKVRSVLRSSEKSLLEHIENRIEIRQKPLPPGLANAKHAFLHPILQSISEKRSLQVQYKAFNKEQSTDRLIEPIGIFYAYDCWHVVAYCHLRLEYRDFRVDRIRNLHLTAIPFSREHPLLKEYLQQNASNRKLQTVVIEVEKTMMRYLETQKYEYGFVDQTEVGDYVEMTFFTAWPEAILRWFILYAEHGRIISPEALIEQFREKITRLYQSVALPVTV
ncbi:YafY family protein [Siphonobacter sp. SORGH_AS_0500]|uniref:helix-turn-helix transcriptional regulator n=1 Tax=Siphonobacter sp. SORGH_AS_0500 TaxID=1864824 RepID=UPI00285F2714|nr:YafY family protein [Siphonobacter sp. SORGH_AS_0500]MDR6193887.1 putative DNA-binding transcriptional regulator YafY [Siphonobacter sp. SORGH_AS_0500]